MKNDDFYCATRHKKRLITPKFAQNKYDDFVQINAIIVLLINMANSQLNSKSIQFAKTQYYDFKLNLDYFAKSQIMTKT